jgi:ABC-type arginine transport system permease subunit
MNRASQAAGATREPFVFYAAVALVYLAFTSLSEAGLRLGCAAAGRRPRLGRCEPRRTARS